MKLGLVRHFKVNMNRKPFLSSRQFEREMDNYDNSPVTKNELLLDQDDWDMCFSSTLPRAISTAKTIYNDEICQSDLLVEVPISPFTYSLIPLPNFLWHFCSRVAWYFNLKSQKENRIETMERISKFLDMIERPQNKNILVVTHGFFMKVLIKELIKRGFKGSIDFTPKNAKLYIFEN